MSTPEPDCSLSPDEQQLVVRLISGDDAAFSEVYAREKATVYGFLLRLTGDSSVAADLFQNVWLKLARNAPKLRPDSHLRGWLLTVARREYISFRRAEAVDLSRLLAVRRTSRHSLEPTTIAALDPTLRDLREALQRLTDSDREIVLVTALENLQPDEAAAVLGLKPEAYRKRLSRARLRLEKQLKADERGFEGQSAQTAEQLDGEQA